MTSAMNPDLPAVPPELEPRRALGLLLAGGLARRMGGGDKPLRTIGGVTILDHVIQRLRPQCGELALNANGDPTRFARWGLPVLPDTLPDHPGPRRRAGRARMGRARARRCQPCRQRRGRHALHPARSRGPAGPGGGRRGPAAGLRGLGRVDASGDRALARRHRAGARQALAVENERKIDRFTARFGCASAEWPVEPIDPFFNANEPDDLGRAEALLARGAIS